MELNSYQELAVATAEYPRQGDNLLYPALGIAGESGEVADKIKKLWRNKGVTSALDKDFTEEDAKALILELGDVLWYVAALANELKVTLNDVATTNINKLYDRKERGVIKSEGDNR